MIGLRESRAELRESSIHSRHLSLIPRNQRVHSGKLRVDAGDQRLGFQHLCVYIKDSTLGLGDERATLIDLCLTPGDESLSVGNKSVEPRAPALESGAPWDGLYEWTVVVGGAGGVVGVVSSAFFLRAPHLRTDWEIPRWLYLAVRCSNVAFFFEVSYVSTAMSAA